MQTAQTCGSSRRLCTALALLCLSASASAQWSHWWTNSGAYWTTNDATIAPTNVFARRHDVTITQTSSTNWIPAATNWTVTVSPFSPLVRLSGPIGEHTNSGIRVIEYSYLTDVSVDTPTNIWGAWSGTNTVTNTYTADGITVTNVINQIRYGTNTTIELNEPLDVVAWETYLAIEERWRALDPTVRTNAVTGLAETNKPSYFYDHYANLVEAKNTLQWIAVLPSGSRWVDPDTIDTNGTLDAWFASGDDWTGVVGLTMTGLLNWAGAPTNYLAYTPKIALLEAPAAESYYPHMDPVRTSQWVFAWSGSPVGTHFLTDPCGVTGSGSTGWKWTGATSNLVESGVTNVVYTLGIYSNNVEQALIVSTNLVPITYTQEVTCAAANIITNEIHYGYYYLRPIMDGMTHTTGFRTSPGNWLNVTSRVGEATTFVGNTNYTASPALSRSMAEAIFATNITSGGFGSSEKLAYQGVSTDKNSFTSYTAYVSARTIDLVGYLGNTTANAPIPPNLSGTVYTYALFSTPAYFSESWEDREFDIQDDWEVTASTSVFSRISSVAVTNNRVSIRLGDESYTVPVWPADPILGTNFQTEATSGWRINRSAYPSAIMPPVVHWDFQFVTPTD